MKQILLLLTIAVAELLVLRDVCEIETRLKVVKQRNPRIR